MSRGKSGVEVMARTRLEFWASEGIERKVRTEGPLLGIETMLTARQVAVNKLSTRVLVPGEYHIAHVSRVNPTA